ncbi:hypothetical protein [Desulfovibrio subterraneus]|jgi:tRNA-dependent cyclodipeptide synthase|uniref:Cyclodipeptide synthase n=1 Tax=Desulfovibrio subterraneus TaxID=2718620 RepID=A0A7J0BIU7_9BACT|nr:hypothetical protein [Desulfovibrio subterraneus]GFM33549.1 hypothetical protein DSM101010T_19140 [Desulfovibrio subterraneus]
MWHDQIGSSLVVRNAESSFPQGAGSRYVAKFRNLQFPKETLYDNVCFVPISLGQEYHEGSKLHSIMQLVNKTFKECVVIVSDMLHRHTLRIVDPDLTMERAFVKSVNIGRQWVENNADAWADLSIPYRIVYWSDLLGMEAYADHRQQLDVFCDEDDVACNLVDDMVGYFVEAACTEGTCSDEKLRVAALSREYLLEEHAIQLRMLPQMFPQHHFVYPHTKRLDPLMDFYERMTGSTCRWLRVRISRKDHAE